MMVGRHEDERDRLNPADFRGGIDPVHVGHLDVGDHQVGTYGPARLDQFPAGLGDGHELMAQAREDFLVIIPHVELIVGNGDLERTGHESPLGKVRMISAPTPPPSPTAIVPPWASTIRLVMGMPRPVPRVLVVKNGSKILCLCSGLSPGP